jgi:hypothetical protein
MSFNGTTAEDLMAGFKNKKFIVVSEELEFDSPMVVLGDFKFWDDNYTELERWCNEHTCKISGMTVNMPDEKTLMLFCLKWS